MSLTKPINRTLVELKPDAYDVAIAGAKAINRTLVELKRRMRESGRSSRHTINRTLVELKLSVKLHDNTFSILSIVP